MIDFVEKEETEKKKENSLWCEKHRPSGLDEFIGNDTIKETFKLYIQKQDIPHLLLYGKAGTGKSSAAKILAKSINCDYIYINSSDESGIETVRNKIKNFSCSAGFKPLKIVILDEFGNSGTPEAQGALRNMLETYSMHTRFILTTNYKEKIIEPIQSRCQVFEIKPISKKDVAIKLVKILNAEGVKYTQDDIVFIINTYYPDIRKVINFAQQSNLNGVLKICKQNAIESDFLQKLIDLLKTPNKTGIFNEIRQLVADIDASSLDDIYPYLFKKVDEYANNGKQPLIIIELAEAIKDSTMVIPAVRDIIFLAMIQKIIKHLVK
jgi:DNA polymerase III delta prime subunit